MSLRHTAFVVPSASGFEQAVTVSGLDSGTEYYIHYVQVDGAAESNVITSNAFTTDASSGVVIFRRRIQMRNYNDSR